MLDLFPVADGDDFTFLVESVRERGVRIPVLVDCEGRTLLHGRARVLAHIAAGRDPTLIPRTMLPPHVRHEAVLDAVMSGALESHHVSGAAFLDLAVTARSFYCAVAARRLRYGAPRPHLSPVTKPTLVSIPA